MTEINASDFGLQEEEVEYVKAWQKSDWIGKEDLVMECVFRTPVAPHNAFLHRTATTEHPFLYEINKYVITGQHVNIPIHSINNSNFSMEILSLTPATDRVQFNISAHSIANSYLANNYYDIARDIDDEISNMERRLEQALFQGSESGINGLQQWLPDVVSGELFCGIDRSIDSVRLAGHRLYAESLERGIVDASIRIAREGGRPDVCYVPAEMHNRLTNVMGPMGSIRVVNSVWANAIYLLSMPTWRLYHLGDLINIDMQRSPISDDYEARISTYCQLGCSNPIYNARITIEEA